MTKKGLTGAVRLLCMLFLLSGCAILSRGTDQYRDGAMDFGAVKKIAIMPLNNVSREPGGAERVRDTLAEMLMASSEIYVLPPGEAARGIARVGVAAATMPSVEEVQKLGTVLQVNAIITGTVREYGEVRSAVATSNVVSLSLQMIETQTGKVIWSASASRGGITLWDRLLGGGGQPMNTVTEQVINDLLEKLFK